MLHFSWRWCLAAVLSGAMVGPVIASPVDDARQAFDQGNYALAVDLYEKAAEATPALLEDQTFMSAWQRAQARVAFDAGSRLHAEGEYDAAVEQFLDAIARDSDYKLAYAALQDAQRAAVRQHLLAAIVASDAGDLLTAKQRLEQSLIHGGGADEQVTAALTSITSPEKIFDEKTLAKLEEAKRLGSDRQWDLAVKQLSELVQQAPLLLPARAELSRATRIKTMSETMTDEAAALIAQQRLSPALEKLAAATSVWPYNKRAAELLENVEAQVKRAEGLVGEARVLADKADWRSANEKLIEALAIDPSHADARSLRSEVRVGLVQMLGKQAMAFLDAGDLTRARELLDRADAYWSNNIWTRGDMARYQETLSERASNMGHPGSAYLRALLASRDDNALYSRLDSLEHTMLREADTTYAYQIDPSTPSLGVSSSDLISALSSVSQRYSQPANCLYLTHGDTTHRPLVQDEQPQRVARYLVRVNITETDIELRQRNSGLVGQSVIGSGSFNTTDLNSGFYWEKYGKVSVNLSIIDTATQQTINTFNSHRWANYTDRRQYVIGTTWNTSYWTLPTDEAIAEQLARDLAAQVQPEVQSLVTLARARTLRAQADALAKDNPAGALDQRVMAVVLAGQVNPRDARRELRKMAQDLDEQQPVPVD